jgi:hypothetical protein
VWIALLQAIGSFAAAGAAWIVLEFFGRPLRKFYDLRGETICLLAQTALVGARWKEIPDEVGSISGEVEALNVSAEQITDLKEAGKLLRDLASRFRAFAGNETYALRFVRWRRYDPMKASAGLFGLSNSLDTYGANRAFQKKDDLRGAADSRSLSRGCPNIIRRTSTPCCATGIRFSTLDDMSQISTLRGRAGLRAR